MLKRPPTKLVTMIQARMDMTTPTYQTRYGKARIINDAPWRADYFGASSQISAAMRPVVLSRR